MTCSHLDPMRAGPTTSDGCNECLKRGESWVQSRRGLICGHRGCGDSPKNRHATAHFRQTGHPLIQSLEPGASWRWCYVNQASV